MMRGMHRARAEVHEEWLVRGDLLGVGDHRPRLGDEIKREVVALFWRPVRLALAVVAYQLRVILVRIAAEKAVVALESPAQRPAVVRPSGRGLLSRREMPFSHGVGVVAVLQEDLGEHPVLEWNVAVAARIARRTFGDARHAVRVMVAPRQEARA